MTDTRRCVRIYIVDDPKGDRPYISTTRPSPERIEAMRKLRCGIYTAVIVLPEKVQPLPSLEEASAEAIDPLMGQKVTNKGNRNGVIIYADECVVEVRWNDSEHDVGTFERRTFDSMLGREVMRLEA